MSDPKIPEPAAPLGILTMVQLWVNNCANFAAQLKSENNDKGAEYYRGAKEAFQRVIDESLAQSAASPEPQFRSLTDAEQSSLRNVYSKLYKPVGASPEPAPARRDENDYVAWLRYPKSGPMVVCDSDSPGAFKVYRWPAPAPATLREVLLRSANLSVEIINLAHMAWTDRENAELLFRSIEQRALTIRQTLDAALAAGTPSREGKV